jgi:hypothetical protein
MRMHVEICRHTTHVTDVYIIILQHRKLHIKLLRTYSLNTASVITPRTENGAEDTPYFILTCDTALAPGKNY